MLPTNEAYCQNIWRTHLLEYTQEKKEVDMTPDGLQQVVKELRPLVSEKRHV